MKLSCDKSKPPLGGIFTAEYLRQKHKLEIEWSTVTLLVNGQTKISCSTSNDLCRALAKNFAESELYDEDPLEKTLVDHWLSFSIANFSKQEFSKSITHLNQSLGPVTYLVAKRLTIADFAVFAALYVSKEWQTLLAKNNAPNHVLRWYNFIASQKAVVDTLSSMPQEVNASLTQANSRQSVEKSVTGPRNQEGKFVDLPGAEMGKVIVRFPPEASGYLHIGHAKAALLNQYYQQAFKGKLIMRFDDTNPAKENVHFEQVILEDLEMLEIKPDLFTHTSNYFDLMLEYCETMLKEGKAYVDDTEPELMKQQREQKIECENRKNSVEKNFALWEQMKQGTAAGQKCCVRAKIDMQSPNGCMRDPTIYRCKNEIHPRTGDKYKVYPTYDFACPIVDAIENVTHTLRTMEYHDRDAQFYWFIEALGLRRPHIWEYSRLSMTNTVLSKRKLTWFVQEKLVDGWDDPRFPTVRGVLRRGMTVEGLKQFIIAQGSSRSVVFMEWDKIWAFNKKVIDPIAPRFTALEYDSPVPVLVKDVKLEPLTVPKHPKNAEVGNKIVWVGPRVLIDGADAETLKEGENTTFINWGNLLIKKINRENGKVTSVEAEPNLDNKDYKKTLKLTWLCDTDQVKFTPCYCVYFEHIINKAVLAKDEDFKKYIGHETRTEMRMLGDPELRNCKKGDIIQLQRRGFFKVDVPYGEANDTCFKERPVILFSIPDGHTKESPTAGAPKLTSFVVCMLCVVCTLCDDHHIENFSTYASSLDTIATKLEEPKGRWCHCWNDTESEVGDGIECRCFGYLLKTLPKKLPNGLEKLTISEAGINVLNKNSLQPYKTALRDVILTNLAHLKIIEPGTFRNIDKLRSLYISHAPLLKSLPMLFEGVSTKNFLSLRIMHTGLEEIPDLSRINQTKILHMVDLEDNELKNLPSNSIKVKAEQVMLNYNQISSIAAYAFDGSEIAKLSLKGNRQLTMLNDESFSGLNSVTELDLSGTNIEYLPVKGLEMMEILRIQETKSLKVIPSVYNFKYLKEAWLTHSFHCCAFMYPAQHDPVEHALHTSKLKQFCDALTLKQNILRSKRHTESMWGESVHEEKSGKISFDGIWGLQFDQPDNESEITQLDDNKSNNNDIETEDEIGTFHQNVFEMPGGSDVLCGKLSQSTHDILCYPKPDALNPCEDIMGSYWLRVSVWFVVVTAVIGNLAVIVVFFSSLFDINVPKFLMCHLACADICMGFYLLLIASMDIHSMGFYFNFAFDWQIGDGCRIAGFLTVFSSQLSVYTLTIITLERWFAIRYAIYLNRRIRLGAAVKIMAVGWVYSILMASLPLFGISNYSSTSICLPMEIQDPQDRAYLVALLLTNGLAFFIIVVCYTQIYFSLGQDTRRGSANNEMTIAKKMALLVFTDFACWAPIAFFGLTALAGYPLIDVTRSKILLVFFYPLNSCANPYLYAILTAQYRRDFFMLLYRFGICKKRVKQYTMTTSLPPSNQSNPVSPLARSNSRKTSKTNHFLDEALL